MIADVRLTYVKGARDIHPYTRSLFAHRKPEVTPLVLLLAITGLFETGGAVAILFGSPIDPTLWLVIGANVITLLFYFACRRHLYNWREHSS